MKIVLNDWEDVKDHVAMLSPALLVEWNAGLQAYLRDRPGRKVTDEVTLDLKLNTPDVKGLAAQIVKSAEDQWAKAHFGHDVHPEGYQGLPADIARPDSMPDASALEKSEAVHADANAGGTFVADEPSPMSTVGAALDAANSPERDQDGAPYHTDWHSSPAKLTDKGVWRARRGRDAGAYAEWLAQYAVEPSEPAEAEAEAEAEPVATETHALPQDESVTEPEPTAADPTLDANLDAVLAQALEIAGDQPDGHIELLAACKAFMTAHSHAAFNDLKAAVAPDGSPGGKSLQNFSPAERRLMQAALAVYPKPE